MAAPVDSARATTDGSSNLASQSFNVPGSPASGDFLLVIIRTPGSRVISLPSDWEILVDNDSSDGADDVTLIGLHECDGTEGATETVTFNSASRCAAICWLITGATAADVSAVASGTTQPDSPNNALQGTRDTLWISLGGMEQPRTLTSGPSGYANATLIAHTGATGVSACTVFGASLQVSSDTAEDPGAWTLSANEDWTAWTIGFYDPAFPVRVSQAPVEAVISPTDQKARFSQVPVEVVFQVVAPAVTAQPFRGYIID